ncbi:fatty-acid amide hydrolase 2-A-like isoform X1 [Microplitis mediator]|uniref:fatty-acid amide hydrolase 2-A-like isoform X1 n=1 Tax=Microplitis mediator TaxID=375433 RepID=UPI00255350D8|nr:fatty-acid amide hydrolase 2-A-like isoform X1 [Microplitis mediator]
MELALSGLTLLYVNVRRFDYAEFVNGAMKVFIKSVVVIVSCAVLPFLKLAAFRKINRCPAISNKLLLIPANQLAKKIRRKEITSEEIVRAYIERCREVNPVLNAIVENRFEAAIKEAREVDQFVKSGIKSEELLAQDTPLLGIPITVKESIAVKGMSHAAGRKSKEPIIAAKDADSVQRVKKAGGIIILVSNTPEMCMCWETYNNVTGTTVNPYDTRRTPGGSSGGEAALLGSAASLLSISSDIGGSARLPAMFCGVFGHKPTPGWVSTDGHMPDSTDPMWPSFLTVAPMVRYSEDLLFYLKVMMQSDISLSRLDEEVYINNIKFYYFEEIPSFLTHKIDSEIITGIHKFIQHLESSQGIKAQKAVIPHLKYAFETSSTMLLNLDGVDTIFDDETKVDLEWKRVLGEIFKYSTCRSSHSVSSILYGLLKKITDSFPKNHFNWLNEKNESLKKQFQEILGDNGVIICPTFIDGSHYPYEIYPRVCDVTYMMIFNAIGLPVTQCPMGLNKNGLPIGFQVVGNVGQDRLTIAVAREVERAFGGWQPPPSVEKEV